MIVKIEEFRPKLRTITLQSPRKTVVIEVFPENKFYCWLERYLYKQFFLTHARFDYPRYVQICNQDMTFVAYNRFNNINRVQWYCIFKDLFLLITTVFPLARYKISFSWVDCNSRCLGIPGVCAVA